MYKYLWKYVHVILSYILNEYEFINILGHALSVSNSRL